MLYIGYFSEYLNDKMEGRGLFQVPFQHAQDNLIPDQKKPE
jgi:hypothetical protein